MSIVRKKISFDLYLEIAQRDNFTCQICGQKGKLRRFMVEGNYWRMGIFKSKKRFEIDHIVSLYNDGTNDKENLRLTCRYCNRAKGSL